MNPMQEYYNAIIGSYIGDVSLPVASPAGASHKPDLDYGLKSESSFSYHIERSVLSSMEERLFDAPDSISSVYP